MYKYTEFDQEFVKLRAEQYRDQLSRWQKGELTDAQFLPLRLQNGWYIQRFAPMLRVAVPYGEISSAQLKMLAHIANEYDKPTPELLEKAQATQNELQASQTGLTLAAPPLKHSYAHFTTRTNVQFNWIPIEKSADVMDKLASVNMHGIQTSGNAIRNITCEAFAGVAADEIVDTRPFAEILRQWSTLHPEFAFLPRKFKIAFNGAKEDRAATSWYDVGLQAIKNQNQEIGFTVKVGGGMGRTPITGSIAKEFLPWQELLNYLEAVVRVYNRYGRRDNKWKARIKILVKSEGQTFLDEVEKEYKAIIEQDGAPHTITQEEYSRVAANFQTPNLSPANQSPTSKTSEPNQTNYKNWQKQNISQHKNPDLCIVTISFKRIGYAPGDANADTLEKLAKLADKYSAGEARLTHSQNLALPWVHKSDLPALYQELKELNLANPNIGLLTDMIACPGGDFCALANARAIPIAAALTNAYQDIDYINYLGPLDLHISGCINSCGHHHSGHIGILGVDKDGKEWYQITLGGSDGSEKSGKAGAGKVIGPSFAAAEVPQVIKAILETYIDQRSSQNEPFIETLRKIGHEPFKQAANQQRQSTSRAH